MPRERVHHGTMRVWSKTENSPGHPPTERSGQVYLPGDQIPEGSTVTEEPSLDVSWQRDLWVQVSIDIPRDKWLEITKEVEAEKDLSSKPIYTETLSRNEINQMIKALRKARDQAFGADE